MCRTGFLTYVIIPTSRVFPFEPVELDTSNGVLVQELSEMSSLLLKNVINKRKQ